jgi:hypothetical protein
MMPVRLVIPSVDAVNGAHWIGHRRKQMCSESMKFTLSVGAVDRTTGVLLGIDHPRSTS